VPKVPDQGPIGRRANLISDNDAPGIVTEP